MVIHGHIENGSVIPHGAIALPNGTEVVISLRAENKPIGEAMSEHELKRYQEALARIDAAASENPGDAFSGADHDRALYGAPS